MIIELDGLKIEVTKKKVKVMRIVVSCSEGRVRVSAPLRASDKEIRDFVYSKRSWIQKYTSGGKFHTCDGEERYNSGEKLILWGKEHTIEIIEGDGESAVADGDRVILYLSRIDDVKARKKAVDELYRRELREKLDIYFPIWEKRLGLSAAQVQIREMKTRWGSCTPSKGSIRINLRLCELDTKCLEYVILHELAHLKYPNHGDDFKAYLSRYEPDWKSIKESMRGL